MDYRELIKTLKLVMLNHLIHSTPHSSPDYGVLKDTPQAVLQKESQFLMIEACFIEQSITALDDLISRLDKLEQEKDLAIKQLRGTCSACKHCCGFRSRGKCENCKWNDTYGNLLDRDEDNWEWHGLEE